MEPLYETTYYQEQIEFDKEGKSNTNILTGPILGTELEGLDSTQYPLLSQPLELSVGAHFSSWEIAEHYIREYGRQKGFVVKRYRVEYHKPQSSNSPIMVKK
ncbi:unnamed protein product [Rhizophagus irregularis]|nr:unnamed protein product [Rhizophagus irregularis]